MKYIGLLFLLLAACTVVPQEIPANAVLEQTYGHFTHIETEFNKSHSFANDSILTRVTYFDNTITPTENYQASQNVFVGALTFESEEDAKRFLISDLDNFQGLILGGHEVLVSKGTGFEHAINYRWQHENVVYLVTGVSPESLVKRYLIDYPSDINQVKSFPQILRQNIGESYFFASEQFQSTVANQSVTVTTAEYLLHGQSLFVTVLDFPVTLYTADPASLFFEQQSEKINLNNQAIQYVGDVSTPVYIWQSENTIITVEDSTDLVTAYLEKYPSKQYI